MKVKICLSYKCFLKIYVSANLVISRIWAYQTWMAGQVLPDLDLVNFFCHTISIRSKWLDEPFL